MLSDYERLRNVLHPSNIPKMARLTCYIIPKGEKGRENGGKQFCINFMSILCSTTSIIFSIMQVQLVDVVDTNDFRKFIFSFVGHSESDQTLSMQ